MTMAFAGPTCKDNHMTKEVTHQIQYLVPSSGGMTLVQFQGGVPLLTSGTPKVFCDIPVTGTEARTQIGTPYYLSPEVTSGVKGGSTSTFRKPPGKLESPKMGNIIFRFHVVSFLGE